MNLSSRVIIEGFHLAFYRLLLRSVPAAKLALKGGCNLRFFFGSLRYSEDMDLDVIDIPVFELRDKVMRVLESGGLASTLRTMGVERIQPPNMATAKQTETAQRFKTHLITAAGEDLPTKIEFSRRGLDAPIAIEPVIGSVTGACKMPSLIAPHYTAPAAIRQKINALASRRQPEARDVFDLFALASRAEGEDLDIAGHLSQDQLMRARERAFAIDYGQYRDKVVSFLGADDQDPYDSREMWDEIRLVAIGLIDEAMKDGG